MIRPFFYQVLEKNFGNTYQFFYWLNQQTFLPNYIKNNNSTNNNNSSSSVHKLESLNTSGLMSSQTASMVVRDLINKNITTLQQQNQQSQLRFKPLEQLLQGSTPITANSSNQLNTFNLPHNSINLPFFKSINIQNANNTTAAAAFALASSLSQNQPTDMATASNSNSPNQESSNHSSAPLNVFNKNIVNS